jgi:hypothetical protein
MQSLMASNMQNDRGFWEYNHEIEKISHISASILLRGRGVVIPEGGNGPHGVQQCLQQHACGRNDHQ